MPTSKTEEQFEKRLMRSRVRTKTLTKKEIDAYLATLPDEADNCEDSEVTFVTPFGNRQTGPDAEETTDAK